ncbi:MAG: winged helix-turn-helix transcriptional regulator [Nitrososphaerota archaeon]|nr:winged helix-turn-helix transcriptional regulator [Nitrososphaerota archaeon]MDG6971294.1 winged helix-turn-helix transcriptional regulator [Nitrososphaerota archaeon]
MSFESPDHMFWWVVVGSKGGPTRAKILQFLCDRPMNTNQLSDALKVNYRTVTFHLEVLAKNRLVTAEGPKYGLIYFPSATCLARRDLLEKIAKEGPSAASFKEGVN